MDAPLGRLCRWQRTCLRREAMASVQPAEVVRGCRVRARQAEVTALKQQLSKVGAMQKDLHRETLHICSMWHLEHVDRHQDCHGQCCVP